VTRERGAGSTCMRPSSAIRNIRLNRFRARPPITSRTRRNGGSQKHSWWDVGDDGGAQIDNCSCRRLMRARILSSRPHQNNFPRPHHFSPHTTLYSHIFSLTQLPQTKQQPLQTTLQHTQPQTCLRTGLRRPSPLTR
jgi:hypothetical protein